MVYHSADYIFELLLICSGSRPICRSPSGYFTKVYAAYQGPLDGETGLQLHL